MTKNRKKYEWENSHIEIVYEISKDVNKKNFNHIIDRNISIIKNKTQYSRITCLSALKHAIESDIIFSRKAKLKKLFQLQ
jgi:hypothetical protein